MSISNEIAIIGVGTTKFGDNFNHSYYDMIVDATYEAYGDAGVGAEEIEAAWLGTCFAYEYTIEGHAGASLADPLCLYPIPVTRVSNYCATGIDAFRNACFAVAAGDYRMALVVGVEKMRDVPPRGSLVSMHVEKGHPVLAKGRTPPGMFALAANRYAAQYGGDVKEAMAEVAVKNHFNGSLNPKAHFKGVVTKETVMNAPLVAKPLGLFDCCPTTDGAAAVIITDVKTAKALGRDYVVVKGIGLSVTTGYWSSQFDQEWDFTGFKCTQEAAAMAYKQAGIKDPSKEIDVAEIHDCFTITEIINYEDLGFCKRGEGRKFIIEGDSGLKGKLPVNPSGGLKSCGHPIGATGVRMIAEITDQLRERCGERQINNARIGLAHNLGGPMAVAAVAILGRSD